MEKDADGSYKVAERENSFIDASDYPADTKISGDVLIRSADERSRAFANETIARLTNDSLAPEDEIPGIPQSRVQDTALVRLLNETMKYYAGCSIAGITMAIGSPNLYKGDIKRKDIANLYKFENTIFKVRMTGRQIGKWVEYSAGFFNTYHEGDLSVSFDPDFSPYEYVIFSGLKFDIDISKPAGSRVRNLTLEDGTPLDPDGKYDVATTDYLANLHLLNRGTVFGDGDELPEVIEEDVEGSTGDLRSLFVDYLVNVKGVKGQDGISEYTAVDITEENANWKIIGCNWDEKKHARAVDLIKEGKIRIEDHQDESGIMIRPITEAELAEAE
jgi:2',3'-cyclic-nucleotide 2'-phosphodiesterase/3'-nucleotidase